MIINLLKNNYIVYGIDILNDYYDINQKDFDGMQLSLDWFKPFGFNASQTSFFSFSGYSDYQFGAKKTQDQSSHGGVIYFDLGYHYKKMALSYGIKFYQGTILFKFCVLINS